MDRRPAFLEVLRERILILDGATGTQLQAMHLTPDDFHGLDGCNEYLNLCNPDVVRRLHAAYLDVGVDGILANSFGANAVVLAEYGLADQDYAIARRAGELAVEMARQYATPERPRFVLGSLGPGTKLPSLGQITFDALYDAFFRQASGLVDGGVDALLVETAQDLLQAKTALIAAREAMEARGVRLPLICSVTIETTGQMLMGSEIGAALTALEPLRIDLFGINCATGPDLMHEHLRYLRDTAPLPIIVQPNAGLPRLENDRTVYDLTPEQLRDALSVFVREYGVSVIGGCCGTRPAHMQVVVDALWGAPPPVRAPRFEPAAASLYVSVPYQQESSFLIVGERANANGSRRFRNLLTEENFDEMANVVREQAREGAHVVDVCVDYVGRNGVADMERLIAAVRGRTTLPIVLDSTELAVQEAGLKLIGGKPIVNSINLEDGGMRLDRTLRAAVRFGAGVIAMVIDEEGQARTAERKVAIARRIAQIATEQYGLRPSDLFFDAITLPLSSGQEELRNDGRETLKAVREIKATIPDVSTILGVSNVSFGLNAAARRVLNSVFLHEAVQAGLDAAIINAAQILPIHKIPDDQRQAARRLIYNEWRDGRDPLQEFMALFTNVTLEREAVDLSAIRVEERLHHRIIDGLREGLTGDLDEALQARNALAIVNETLLPAMQVVGDLFGSGQMQLPFVLQSAETMKAAVKYLEPHMEKSAATGKGAMVIATVRGDVHDIGKNLVDIILSNNGFTVHNLGIKQPIHTIIEAAEHCRADAIGLSGLLVKSTLVMKEDLIELNRLGLAGRYPVVLGGAALTRAYVEHDLRDLYAGRVYYGQDAFEGLAIMNALVEGREPAGPRRPAPLARPTPGPPRRAAAAAAGRPAAPPAVARGRSAVRTDVPIPAPPFWGRRAIRGISLQEIYPYLNEVALFRGQWGFRKGSRSDADFEALLEQKARPALRRLEEQAIAEGICLPAVVYGYFPVRADGDDLIVYHEDRRTERLRFRFPRQENKQRLCLADYFRPIESGQMDVAAFHIVTVGAGASVHNQTLFQANRYQDYLYWHGFSVELAEALAEYWHRRIRLEWGIAGGDGPTPKDLFAGRYQGARFSFGYPACPNLEDQAKLMDLLRPEEIGVSLSEEFQLAPEQSTSAIITHHPQAAYFNL